MTDEQADAMPVCGVPAKAAANSPAPTPLNAPAPDVPNSPDAEPPLTDHEEQLGRAYVLGHRAAAAGRPYVNPYFTTSDEGKAWRSGYMDLKASQR